MTIIAVYMTETDDGEVLELSSAVQIPGALTAEHAPTSHAAYAFWLPHRYETNMLRLNLVP